MSENASNDVREAEALEDLELSDEDAADVVGGASNIEKTQHGSSVGTIKNVGG